MPFLKTISFPEVVFVQDVSMAVAGTLLQIAPYNLPIRDNDKPAIIGLRCDMKVANGFSHGIVLLENNSAGTFVSDADLANRPAIDISSIAEVVLAEPAPYGPVARSIQPGDVCSATIQTANDYLCMAVRLPNLPNITGYALLYGNQRGHIIGVKQQYYIGKAAIVPIERNSAAKECGDANEENPT